MNRQIEVTIPDDSMEKDLTVIPKPVIMQISPERRPLTGAVELLKFLKENNVTYGIATSGRRPEIDKSLEALGVGDDVVVVDRGIVVRAKPAPDLFLACFSRASRELSSYSIDQL